MSKKPQPQRRTDSSDVWVYRQDRVEARLAEAERTPQGFLRAQMAVAVPCIMEYQSLDGTVTLELIDEEELHDPDSLESLASAPITLDHPDEDVTPKNVQELGVGDAGEQVDILRETGHIRIGAVIRRQDALEAIENGKIEISPGYKTIIIPTPGVHPELGRYDARQTKRRYNHIAIVDEARGGSTVRLRADGARQAVTRLDALSAPTKPPPIEKPAGDTAMNSSILMLAALAGFSIQMREDAAFLNTDEGEDQPVTEAQVAAMIAEALKAKPAEGDAEGEGGGENKEELKRLQDELQKAMDRAGELQGQIDALTTEKKDREDAAKAAADKEERVHLDSLAEAEGFDIAKWREDTSNDDRKLDIVRHKGIVKEDEKREPAEVDGMIAVLTSDHTDSKTETPPHRADGGAWRHVNEQVPAKPVKGGDDPNKRADGTDKPADSFNANIKRMRENAKKSA